MDLQQKFRLQFFCPQPCIHSDHCTLDDIGSGTLHGRIDGRSLCRSTHHGARRCDVRYPKTAAKSRFHITVFCRLSTSLFHIALHAGKLMKVLVDIGCRHLAIQPHLLREAKSAHTVYQTKVDHFRHAALIRRHLIQRRVEYFRSR